MENGNGIAVQIDDSAQARIKAWLLEEGYTVSTEDRPNAKWLLVGKAPKGKIVVGQPSDAPDRVLISASIAVADEHQAKFNKLPKTKRDEFLWDLRFALLQTDVEFEGVKEPLDRLALSEIIFAGALTKDRFVQRVAHVRKGTLLILWKFQHLFEENPDKLGFLKG